VPPHIPQNMAGMPGGMGGMPGGMGGGMGGPMGGMQGMEEFQVLAQRVKMFVNGCYYLGIALIVGAVFYFGAPIAARLIRGTPDAARWAKRAAGRKRRSFEKAVFIALASVCVPILLAQIGLLAGPLLPPVVGWRIYVYGSFIGGTSATVLSGYALYNTYATGENEGRVRAGVSGGIGVIVLGLLLLATSVHAPDRKAPVMNDMTTNFDDPPLFHLLADANHTAGYPEKFLARAREYYTAVEPKKSFLPIGASFIRAITLAEEQGYKIVTPIAKSDRGTVEPYEWMDKDEIGFEATHVSRVFRIPDEVVWRFRKHKFDDGYEGSLVDMRSRSHLPNDQGSNSARITKFFADNNW